MAGEWYTTGVFALDTFGAGNSDPIVATASCEVDSFGQAVVAFDALVPLGMGANEWDFSNCFYLCVNRLEKFITFINTDPEDYALHTWPPDDEYADESEYANCWDDLLPAGGAEDAFNAIYKITSDIPLMRPLTEEDIAWANHVAPGLVDDMIKAHGAHVFPPLTDAT